MSLSPTLSERLALPVIGAPMFIISSPELVIAQCRAGIVGAFPALNARGEGTLDAWLSAIRSDLAEASAADPTAKIAPFAVNQIVHPTNKRLDRDMALCEQHEVPIVITSLSKPTKIVERVHGYGGVVFHDVINISQARKAIESGVDGLILVCAGAGGHTGTLNPFAFVDEVRRFYDGTIVLSGAISNGRSVYAATSLGADLAYVGTLFIASEEAATGDRHKRMIVDSAAGDIVCTDAVTGVSANFLAKSFEAIGIDPRQIPKNSGHALDLSNGGGDAKAWRDVWGAGQGVGRIETILPAGDWIFRLRQEFEEAQTRAARRR